MGVGGSRSSAIQHGINTTCRAERHQRRIMQ